MESPLYAKGLVLFLGGLVRVGLVELGLLVLRIFWGGNCSSDISGGFPIVTKR